MVGDREDTRIVRRDHERRAARRRRANRAEERLRALAVELGGRLVDDDDRRIARKRDRERGARELAPGKLGRPSVQAMGYAELLEQLARSAWRMLGDRQMREEIVGRALRHVGDAGHAGSAAGPCG